MNKACFLLGSQTFLVGLILAGQLCGRGARARLVLAGVNLPVVQRRPEQLLPLATLGELHVVCKNESEGTQTMIARNQELPNNAADAQTKNGAIRPSSGRIGLPSTSL